MSDYESVVDHWIDQSIKHHGDSDTALKKHCIYASPIVGKYSNGGTKAIADGIHRSPSTVENHAHAHWLYVELRNTQVRSCVRTLWRTLPASHWWQAWTIQKAGYDAYHYLNQAALHGWAGREMMDSFKKDMEAGNAPLIFKRGIHALRGLVAELLNKFNRQLSEAQKVALLTVVDAFTAEAE